MIMGLQGPVGPDGLKGELGAQGEKGEKAERGPRGEEGLVGQKVCKAFQISFDSVYVEKFKIGTMFLVSIKYLIIDFPNHLRSSL